MKYLLPNKPKLAIATCNHPRPNPTLRLKVVTHHPISSPVLLKLQQQQQEVKKAWCSVVAACFCINGFSPLDFVQAPIPIYSII